MWDLDTLKAMNDEAADSRPHRERHVDYVDGCFACKIQTVKLGPGTQPSKSEAVEKFYATGDPAVFAKPGALDYDPDVSVD